MLIYSAGQGLIYLLDSLEPLPKMVHYKSVKDTRWFKDGLQKYCIQTKMYRLYRKMTIYGHFSI